MQLPIAELDRHQTLPRGEAKIPPTNSYARHTPLEKHKSKENTPTPPKEVTATLR
jgi:hypothetical protein